MTDERKQVVLDQAFVFEGPDGAVRVAKARGSTAQQLGSDPFSYRGRGESGLVRPPYNMDELLALMGSTPGSWGNALHTRCVKQKALDVLGRGVELRAKEPDAQGEKSSSQQEDQWAALVDRIEDDDRGEGSLKERLTWAHEDFESIGWAVLEIGRDTSGDIDGLWHVPGNTVRAHADGKLFAQKVAGKLTWFKRYGLDGRVDADTGEWSNRTAHDKGAGHELLVIRNYTPSSSYYGLPDHIPALAAMTGWRAQSEFNIRFFGNQAVPSYAVVIEGATLTPALEDTIKDHFRQIKGDPARTIVIPIPAVLGAGEAMQPKLRFERLSVDTKEASFRLYRQDNALEILISHGVPPYRIGWPLMGSMGGATAEEMTHVYLDSIVQPRQETWEQRLTRALLGKKGLQITDWHIKANELDTRNEERDLAKARALYELGVTTPNDSARFFGYDEREDEGGGAYIKVPLAPAAAGSDPAADPGADPSADLAGVAGVDPVEAITKHWSSEVRELAELRKRVEAVLQPTAV